MPFYQKLTAKAKVAWAQAKVLQKCLNEASKNSVDQHDNIHVVHYGYEIMDGVVDCVNSANLPKDLCNAVSLLRDAATNYGDDYTFEFNRANLAVWHNGDLILLDTLFSMATVRKMRGMAMPVKR